MRNPIVLAASLLFVVASAFAQQTNHSNTVSVFVSDLSISQSSTSGTNLDTAYGAAFDHRFSDYLSAELSVTRQPIRRYFTTFSSGGVPTATYFSDQLYPIDANISYHFLTDSRWKPYVGAGLRYLNNTARSNDPLGVSRLTSRSVDPEVSGGVTFQFRPNLGLRFDAKQTIGSSGSVLGDAAFTGSLGLSFRF